MEKIYSFIKATGRLRYISSLLLVGCIILYGCFELKTITQPTSAYTYSYFDVEVICKSTATAQGDGYGFFGVLMPIGWQGQEKTPYTVYNPDGSEMATGHFEYYGDYANRLNELYGTPEGYYWWTGRSAELVPIWEAGDFSFTFRISTNGKTGNFNLKYAIGSDCSNMEEYVKPDRDYPIEITTNPDIVVTEDKIEQPENAETYSSFDVEFICKSPGVEKGDGREYLGVLLPNGWRGQEHTNFTVYNFDGSIKATGRSDYYANYAQRLHELYGTPEGYYWWTMRSTLDVPISGATDIGFTLRVHTDDQTGDFVLRYVIAYEKNAIEEYVQPFVDHPINITANTNLITKENKVEQPTNAETHSFLDVNVQYTSTEDLDGRKRTYFGALLPKGWRVQDYTDYNVINKDGTHREAMSFSYDQYYSDQLERDYETPTGYYWWGGRTMDDHMPIYKNGYLAVKFRIFTGDQPGNYNLRYTMGIEENRRVKDIFNENTLYPVTVTQGSKIPMKKEVNWELLSPETPKEHDTEESRKWDENIQFYADNDYNNFYKRYYGWIGGDIGRSAPLGDGRSIWVWGDSDTGKATSDRIRLSDEWQFERNFIIVQDGEDFSSFRLINEGSPSGYPNGQIKELVIPTDENGNNMGKHTEWYWPAGSSVYYRDGVPELQVVLSRVRDTGDGTMWAMEGVSADVAVFSLPDLKLKSVHEYKHRTTHVVRWVWNDDDQEYKKEKYSLDFGGYVFKDDDDIVYIYGIGDIPGICSRLGYAARVKDGDLTGDWEFYNKATDEWSTDISWQQWDEGTEDPDLVLDRWEKGAMADNPIFVFKDGNKYFGMAQPGACFSPKIEIYDAETPYGPFSNTKAIGVMPYEIAGDDYFFCSLLAVHPQYSKNGELFFCLSKNWDDTKAPQEEKKHRHDPNPGSADTYLPYFFRSENWRDKLNIAQGKANNDLTDNKGILTAQYDTNIEYLTDNTEETVYSAPSSSAWMQYESPTPANVRRYTITSAENEDKDPLHWKLLGSNDGENWTVLDERYYAEFKERNQTVNYVVQIDGDFTHFRLDVLESKGGSTLEIAEWQMFGRYNYELGVLAELEEVKINNEIVAINDVINYSTILSPEVSEIEVELKAKDYSNISGVRPKFTAPMDKAGVLKYGITITSEDGNLEKEYELVIDRWFAFDDIVKVKWNNTLMLYNNKLDEYDITGYQWYKNNSAISGATGQSYSAGSKKSNLLDRDAEYHITFKSLNGDLRSEAKKITLNEASLQVYPNPVKANSTLTVEADMDEEILKKATVELYSIFGNKVSTTKVQSQSTNITMPSVAGTYLVKFISNDQFEKTVKVIVK